VAAGMMNSYAMDGNSSVSSQKWQIAPLIPKNVILEKNCPFGSTMNLSLFWRDFCFIKVHFYKINCLSTFKVRKQT
jgi:hypothetical protein